MKKIKDIGERALLNLFEQLVDEGSLPFNDDAVAISLDNDKVLVINIDTFVATTDAPKGMSPFQIGAKATTMAISDLAAKGVQPIFTLASGSFPDSCSVEDSFQIVKGISDTTHHYGAKYLGGDTNEADDIIISVVAAGIEFKDKIIERKTSKENDLICVTGKFGLTGAGFKVNLEGYNATKEQLTKFNEAIYLPKARLQEGLFLKQSGKVTACIDSSDGLAWCLKELLRNKNGFGIIIDNLPIDQDVLDFATENNLIAEDLALYTGEEFELVFTVSASNLDWLLSETKKLGFTILPIGKIITDQQEKIMLQKNSEKKEITARGWEHFKFSEK
ncbi:MAG: thiamine-phosphate kinase [Candidatus Thorarchaeota archaeon]